MNKESLTQKVKVKLGLSFEIFNHNGRNINAGGVYRVIQIGNKMPYAAITAFRKGNTYKENSKRNEELLQKIKGLSLSAYNLIGFYKECPEGKPDCDDKEKQLVEEESFFVPYNNKVSLENFISSMHKLGNEFGQDSILVGLPEKYDYEKDVINLGGTEIKTGSHYYLYSNGSLDNIGKKITPSAITEYGSRVIDKKKRKIDWKVTGTLQPSSVMGMTGYKLKGLLFIEGINPKNSQWYDSLENYRQRVNNAEKFILGE